MHVSLGFIIPAILAFVLVTYFIGNMRAAAATNAGTVRLHSRQSYYGAYVGVIVALSVFATMALWLIVEPIIVNNIIEARLPADVRDGRASDLALVLQQIVNVATSDFSFGAPDYVVALADDYTALREQGRSYMLIALAVVAVIAFFIATSQVKPGMRARNRVETVVRGVLIVCSAVAILTTIGIVVSMLFESLRFFSMVPASDFFFGLDWDPRFSAAGAGTQQGQFGLAPLLWGTLFITILAMLVAVPIGLMSAIYLSEYASPRFRASAKPTLEVLAGIPTVVYGFFALITVGPFLNDAGASLGLTIDARSALTAGLVMGIMIIPFVSSLSDDVISAVPQAMRDGSYAMGATKSETVRRVLLPAALPGIVGSVILATSRAIGETMIVVMAAGVTAKLTANPFESVTTVTVKIVSQLTGDQEFTSPQTLVAFALGMTLFVITLCLNVYALRIVRKYREQYD